MKRQFISLVIAMMLMSASGCGSRGSSTSEPVQNSIGPQSQQEYVEAERIPVGALPVAVPDQPSAGSGAAFRGGVLRPNGKSLEIVDSTGIAVAVNPSILRIMDEGGNCPSEGFQRIAVKGDFFTIEQQSCGGMLFIDEYITFKAENDGKIYLHKFSIVKTDREDPERRIPQRDLTTKEFGKVEFGKVELEALYEMF